jgi:hypothetical protein
MRSLLRYIFLDCWERKLISVCLAVVIWMAANHAPSTHKVYHNIAVRVINVPPDHTILGIKPNGLLPDPVSLHLKGDKTVLDQMTFRDFEVVIDASNKQQEWMAKIGKRNLTSFNPEWNLKKLVHRVAAQKVPVHLTPLVTEKIPVIVTQPLGEPPAHYQFLDINPYRFEVELKGPEAAIKQLKAKGIRLTFSLDKISKSDLDKLATEGIDLVNFPIPNDWKKISIPSISDHPILIDHPQAQQLAMEFTRSELIPLSKPIPITLFFPPDAPPLMDAEHYSLAKGQLLHIDHGQISLTKPLYAKGVSAQFAQIVEKRIQLSIVVDIKGGHPKLDWSVQFIQPQLLEDKYVSTLMSGSTNFPSYREARLRDHFRNYMQKFQLCHSDGSPLNLDLIVKDGKIHIQEN